MATYVVSGSNRGIGLELARRLKTRGETVIALCRRASAELSELGVEIEEDIDVTDDAVIERVRGRIGERRVDVLINNAGILTSETLDDLDFDRIRRQLETNSLGPLRLSRALLDNIPRGGKVAIVTSRMGSIADNTSGSRYGYRMSKAAVNMAGVSLAHDLKPRGVAVLLLHPGYVRTEMTGNHGSLEPAEAAEGLLARIDALSLETTGRFLHQSGEALPW